MKKYSRLLVAVCCLAFSMAVFAQGDMKDDNMKSDHMKAMGKSVAVTGKISDDGMSFTSDKDGKSWTISNPDAVKGHEGHHVTLKGHPDADKGAIQVTSLKMAKDNMKNDNPK